MTIRTYGLLAVGTTLSLVASGALAFEVSETSMQELGDLSIIEFESSFCEVGVGDTVTVNLTGLDGDAATATIVAATVKSRNGATPNRGKRNGGERTATIAPVILAGARSVDIILTTADEGWHTVHTRLELSTGERLGVNLHSTPCVDDEAPV